MGRGDLIGAIGGTRPLKERGASIVEFALIVPLLVLLLCGIIEVGWLFAQNMDVRQGADEAARLAAVDDLTDPSTACDRLDIAAIGAEIVFERDGTDVGDEVRAIVTTPAQTLTGVLDWAFPSSMKLEHTAKVRLEQQDPTTWMPVTVNCS